MVARKAGSQVPEVPFPVSPGRPVPHVNERHERENWWGWGGGSTKVQPGFRFVGSSGRVGCLSQPGLRAGAIRAASGRPGMTDAAAASSSAGQAAGAEEPRPVWMPERVERQLEQSKTLADYKDKRVFTFLHLFSGPEDILAQSLQEECKRNKLQFEPTSLDRKMDPESDLSTHASKELIEGDVVAGAFDYVHGGFPCGSFSRARWNQSGHGPPPVRSGAEIYGLSTNTPEQQAEADKGTLMAVQTTHLVQKQIGSCRARAVPPLGTTENPPGDERCGSAWAVPEIRGYLTEVEAQFVEFTTCSFQTERVRWYKPAKWAGRLEGLPTLSRVRRCPSWVSRESLTGKSKTERAAAYPPEAAVRRHREVGG